MDEDEEEDEEDEEDEGDEEEDQDPEEAALISRCGRRKLSVMTPDAVIDTLIALDPLSDLPRTGWLLRGIASPETLAAHTFGVAMVASLLTDAVRANGREVDGERVLRMALVHDAAEARTGDVPMPNKSPEVSAALHALEQRIVDGLLPAAYRSLWREAEAGESIEARIVKAADKIQMMIKVMCYERYRSAHLDEFWANPGNFRDMGLPEASAVYDAICSRAGRERPRRDSDRRG